MGYRCRASRGATRSATADSPTGHHPFLPEGMSRSGGASCASSRRGVDWLVDQSSIPMTSVGSYAAKTHLPALLERVARGERILITRRGLPIALLTQPPRQT